jgi:hypothetical protein
MQVQWIVTRALHSLHLHVLAHNQVLCLQASWAHASTQQSSTWLCKKLSFWQVSHSFGWFAGASLLPSKHSSHSNKCINYISAGQRGKRPTLAGEAILREVDTMFWRADITFIMLYPHHKTTPKCSSCYKLLNGTFWISSELFCARVVRPFMACHAQRGRSKSLYSFYRHICSFTIELFM